AHQVADGPGSAVDDMDAFTEPEDGVHRAARAHLVVDARERDVVALSDRAVARQQELGHDEEADALRSRRRIRETLENEVNDVLPHVVLAAADPHLRSEDP